MAGRSRLSLAKADIVKTIEQTGKFVFRQIDLSNLLSTHAGAWRLAQSTTVNDFIEFLLKNTPLERWRAPFRRPVIRYVWKQVPLFELVQSIDAHGYLSHYSAISLNGLTSQQPKTIFFIIEHPASGGGGELTQRGIDLAFRSKCRISNDVADFEDHRICALHGKNTQDLGVESADTTFGRNLRVTNLERTLIDAVVRPVYSGGVFEVARSFREAADRVSVNRMCAYLRTLKFVYPYHQAIGFYMEHSGAYKNAQIDLLRQFPREFDFYLAHAIKDKQYDKAWRLHIPHDF